MNILITGTSSGVGAGLANYYLDRGNEVFGISRKRNELLERESFHFLAQDLSNFDEVKENLPRFLSKIKKLDLVILNAGKLNKVKDLQDTSLEEIKATMDINVWANKILIDMLFQTLDRIDQVVAISSGASVSGSRGWNAYSLSKATLNMLVNLYAKELSNTHFCALAPGLIDTNMQDYIYSLTDEEKYPVVRKLKQAKGTDQMPEPETAAIAIVEAIEKARSYESGEFLDIRSM